MFIVKCIIRYYFVFVNNYLMKNIKKYTRKVITL